MEDASVTAMSMFVPNECGTIGVTGGQSMTTIAQKQTEARHVKAFLDGLVKYV
jgi:hypothetical protein